MKTTRYTELGQNRIDYIVYHNILEAQKLLYDEGFESVEDPEDLVDAIKELVREKGRKIIEALLKIHPDKKAILSMVSPPKVCENCKTKLDDTKKSGCGSCKKASALPQDNFISESGETDRNTRLEALIKKHRATPNDSELEKEIEALWNSLRSDAPTPPLKEELKTETSYALLTKRELGIYASIFGVGMFMGWVFSFSKNS
ncbi:hypothetical protein [uncultured Dokdonia sp.]|uniref:hypothetical protein n=1 Tax=uncultured Dokdonia sp. TaxID=575653 RepID=UPI00262FDACB|nr:hypothetical protein [uncultured Dokdonia sp.]